MLTRAILFVAASGLLFGGCDGTPVAPPLTDSPALGLAGPKKVSLAGTGTYAPDLTAPPVDCGGGIFADAGAGPTRFSHGGSGSMASVWTTCVLGADLVLTGTTVMTVANGDSYFADMTATLELPTTGPVAPFTMEGTIVGGTGRFQGASGYMHVTGENDFSDGTGTYTFTGAISTVGSK